MSRVETAVDLNARISVGACSSMPCVSSVLPCDFQARLNLFQWYALGLDYQCLYPHKLQNHHEREEQEYVTWLKD